MLLHQALGAHAAGVGEQRPIGWHEVGANPRLLGIEPQAEQVAKQIGVVVEPELGNGEVALAGPEQLVILAEGVTIPLLLCGFHHGPQLARPQIPLAPTCHQRPFEVEAGGDVEQQARDPLPVHPGDVQTLLAGLRAREQRVAHQGFGKQRGGLGQRHGVVPLLQREVPQQPAVPGVPELVGERDDVVHGALEGEEHPGLGGIGILGAIGAAAPVVARCGIDPAPIRHHAGEGPHLGIEGGEGLGHQRQCLSEAKPYLRRGGRRGIEIPGGEVRYPLGASHGPQGPSAQLLVGFGLRHQGLQGGAIQVPLVAGEIQRIEQPPLAALGGELVAPAVDGVEDGGHRLLLRLPGGLNAVPGTGAPRPVRMGEQVVRLGQPHGLPLHHGPESGHQAVVEIPPGLQAVHRQPLDQLLALEGEGLILQPAIVANEVGQLEQLGILQQGPHLILGGIQPEQGHRLDELGQPRLQLLATGEQHPGGLVAAVAAEPVVGEGLAVPGLSPHGIGLAANGTKQVAQGVDVPGLWQGGQQGSDLGQGLGGALEVGVDRRAIGGGIDVVILPEGGGHNCPCLFASMWGPCLCGQWSPNSTKGAGPCLAPILVSKQQIRPATPPVGRRRCLSDRRYCFAGVSLPTRVMASTSSRPATTPTRALSRVGVTAASTAPPVRGARLAATPSIR